MRHVLVLGLLLACKDEPTGKKKHEWTVEVTFDPVEIRGGGGVSLVPGTRRVALRAGSGWWEMTGTSFGENVPLGAAITSEIESRGGIVDVFLGTTPIVSGGEEHRETNVRFKTARVPITGTRIDFDAVVTKVEVTRDNREVWLYEHELDKHITFIDDDKRVEIPPFELIGPPAESASPVSARLCAKPKVIDIAAVDNTVFALVGECNDLAPLRIVAIEADGTQHSEQRLQSRKELGITFEKLVVGKDRMPHLVGVRGGKLSIDDKTFDPITRVTTAIADDKGVIWALVLDAAGKPAILKNGKRMKYQEPVGLALDDALGYVILERVDGGYALHAEKPSGMPVVIKTRP